MKLLAFDVETIGDKPEYALQPWRLLRGEAKVRSYAVAWREDGEIRTRAELDPTVLHLQAFLKAHADHVFVGWYTQFDIGWLLAMGLQAEVEAIRWLDAMLLWKHLVRGPEKQKGRKVQRWGLKRAVTHYYPQYAGYEKNVNFAATTQKEVAKLLQYNQDDARYTLQLTFDFLEKLTPEQKRSATIEAASIVPVAQSNINGLCIDVAHLHELGKSLQTASDTLLIDLQEDHPDVTPELLASPQQLATLLYEDWGLTPPKQTEKGADSTDKFALHALGLTDERAKVIRGYREAVGNKTKFVDGTLNALTYNGDMRVRPQAQIGSTYTGRMTFESKQGYGKDELPIGIPIHQWVRNAEYRKSIIPPPGYQLLELDFAGQEFRWMAVLSGDETMLALCAPGEDAHAFMGAEISHTDYKQLIEEVHAGWKEAKRKRQFGKVANLALGYRTSANKLLDIAPVQHGLTLTAEEAQHVWSTYRKTYPGVQKYWSSQIQFGRFHKYVETVAGRRIQLTGWGKNGYGGDWSLESTAINFPVQGTGADQKYLAIAFAKSLCREFGAKFYFELHDGLFYVVPNNVAELAATRFKDVLSNLPYDKAWGVQLPIKFPVDAKLGPSWGELQEIA